MAPGTAVLWPGRLLEVPVLEQQRPLLLRSVSLVPWWRLLAFQEAGLQRWRQRVTIGVSGLQQVLVAAAAARRFAAGGSSRIALRTVMLRVEALLAVHVIIGQRAGRPVVKRCVGVWQQLLVVLR